MAGPVLLVDVYALFYRALFALPPLSTLAGEPTAGLYGFSALLLKLLREERPAGAAFAIDSPVPTFRHVRYDAYKGTRVRAELPGGAFTGLAPLLRAFGFPVFAAGGFEADDLLMTLARRLAADGERPLVVSGDLDVLQCARWGEVLIVSRAGAPARRYDAAAVEERFGVAPERLPDWKALVGDPTDNLPGVPGIGPRRAAALIARHGELESVLARVEELTPEGVRRAIREHAAVLPLWKELATLREDAPLPEPPWWTPLGPDARHQLGELFERLEFRSLVPRLEALPVAP